MCQVLRKMPDFAISTNTRFEFRKLLETIWLAIINEIYKFPPHLEPFCQEIYLHKLFLGYNNSQLKNDTFGPVSRLLDLNFVNYRKPYG